MSRSDDYLRWSAAQEKVRFQRDETGRIAKVIKRVDATALPVFRALMQLQTPHLPQILSITELDAGMIQVEESYIEGESLREYLETCGTLDAAELQRCFMDIAKALKLLHSLKPPIIHRDIKPSNIIKSKAGPYVLVDFDAAREYAAGQSTDTRIMLTPGYAAPEQYGFGQSDSRSDIFMLGATIFNMRTGEPFRPGCSMPDGGLGRIIGRCTAMAPKSRYQNAGALIRALNRLRTRKRRNILLSAAASLAILCAGGLWYYARVMAIPCTCTLNVTRFTTNLDELDFHEGDAPIELELEITPQIDRSVCRAKDHAETCEVTLINIADAIPGGIGFESPNRLRFDRPGRVWLSAYVRFNGKEYHVDTFEQVIGSPRCTCVADMDRVRIRPNYIVLEDDRPVEAQLTLDYTGAIIRSNCPAEEHAPTPLPAEFRECFLDRGAQERGTAHLTQQGLLTAYRPDCFNISIRASYNGFIGGRGEPFYILSRDQADTFIPMIEDSCRDGCTCRLDADKIALSWLETEADDGERQLQIVMDASNAYLRQDCTAEAHSVLDGELINHFSISKDGKMLSCTENGRITDLPVGICHVMLLTSLNGTFYEVERDLKMQFG